MPFLFERYAVDHQGESLELWEPLVRNERGRLGFYDDSRFPGRLLWVLAEDHRDLATVPLPLLSAFMEDLQKITLVQKAVTGAARVNVAFLSNSEPQVHAHLIPRFPTRETYPQRSPWDDPRPKKPLLESEKILIKASLLQKLLELKA